MKTTNAVARKLAKTYRLHGEALSLFTQGWAVIGASWRGGHWMIEPNGSVHRSHTPASGYIDFAKLLVSTERKVVLIMQSGGVVGKYSTLEEKQAQIRRDADRWHASAFEGWADRPGEERSKRLSVEVELRRIAEESVPSQS